MARTFATMLRAVKTASTVGLLTLCCMMACDLGKTTSQLTAKSVAVATILATPAVTLTPSDVAIPDGSIPTFDGGLPFSFDAGAFLSDAGFTVPPQTVAYLFFGQRQGDSLDVAPVGIPAAKVTLTEVGGKSWPLSETGNGNYQLVGEDAGFAYKSSATYDFTVEQGGGTFVAEVEAVPTQERITQFHPAGGPISLKANQPFSFTRPEPQSGVDANLGFVTVFPVNRDGSRLAPSYTNVPMAPLEFLKLVLAPQEWKTTSVTVPGTAFPSANANYVIVLQSVKLGGPKSNNLFSGSAILAGTADIGVVKTQP